LSRIQQFPPFQQWLQALDEQTVEANASEDREEKVAADKITIQSVDEFGSGKIGFVKFAVDARLLPGGRRVPGVVFMRGGAVAVLIVLRTHKTEASKRVPSHMDEDSYVLLTEQPRVPVPHFRMLELPAGMLDGQTGQFAGAAAREIQEETGLLIEPEDLIDLTDAIIPSANDTAGSSNIGPSGLYPSSGGCDEFIRLFACEKTVSEDELANLRGKLCGLRDEGEFITLRLVKLKDLWRSTRDMKATSALYLWDRR
ncbi:hypothetical protein GQ54DRAFT_239020, partial [Martensiomyces pterosporus]